MVGRHHNQRVAVPLCEIERGPDREIDHERTVRTELGVVAVAAVVRKMPLDHDEESLRVGRKPFERLGGNLRKQLRILLPAVDEAENRKLLRIAEAVEAVDPDISLPDELVDDAAPVLAAALFSLGQIRPDAVPDQKLIVRAELVGSDFGRHAAARDVGGKSSRESHRSANRS